MAKLVIFGIGDAAELAHFYFATDSGHEVAAFCVDAAYVRETTFLGLPVVAAEDAARLFPPTEYEAFVAIGYTRLNRLRAQKCAAMQAAGYKLVSYVSSRAIVFPDWVHGRNCFVQEACVIQPCVRFGDHVTMWSGGHVAHHTSIGDNVFLAPRVAIAGRVEIGAGCFIGINATIRDSVKIGQECVVSAGAVVLADAPDRTLLGAHPAVPSALTPRG